MNTTQLATIVAILLFASPVLVSADSFGIQPTLGQLLSRLAAVKSILSGKQIGCEVAATKTSVKVGEPFTIAWGSYGAVEPARSPDPKNAYAHNGQQEMMIHRPETRTYEFSFYAPDGRKESCLLTISVSQ